eukprot:gene6206-7713_t
MYWLAGDNPRNSLDSRSYGPVPRSRILGRATHRLSLGFPFVSRIDAQVPTSTLEEERRILELPGREERQVVYEQLQRMLREQQRALHDEEEAVAPVNRSQSGKESREDA